MRFIASLFFGAVSLACLAQFPLVRSLEVRYGQRRPAIDRVVQDEHGLMCVASDAGLLRTDGERVEVILPTEQDRIVALAAATRGVIAMTTSGILLRCDRGRCDTLMHIPALGDGLVRSMVSDAGGTIWIATYGKGLARVGGGKISYMNAAGGLPDDHVNDLALLPDGRVVVATDQGLAICKGDRVERILGDAQGAPDNLTLSVDVADDGSVWAGTDRNGVFQWRHDHDTASVVLLNTEWHFGPVHSVRVVGGMVWAGTEAVGPIAIDRDLKQGTYRSQEAAAKPVRDLLLDRDGAIWWCDGTELLHRADPAILIVPEHEGLDLKHITALCADYRDRIWFATPDGLFQHVAWFSEERTVTRVPLPLDRRNPIVSLAADKDGTVWAATLGGGVIAMLDNGPVFRYTTRDGLSNNNVLAARRGAKGMWFATLEGLSRFDGNRFHPVALEAGFTFDVAELDNVSYVATDGHGVVRVDRAGVTTAALEGRSCYMLTADAQGALWTAGPGTGFCRVVPQLADPIGAGRPPFDGDVFALCAYQDRLIVFGSTGVTALHPATGELSDVTAALGLEGITAELNVATTDRSGALWLGCSKGLVRLRPTEGHFDRHIPVSFLSVLMGTEAVEPDSAIDVAYDRNTFTVRFTGLHYVDPSAVRFEYRLVGQGEKAVGTRDRELTFAGLRAGSYTFRIRAFAGDDPGDAPWKEIHFTISPPWWRTPWAFLGGALAVTAIVFLFVRSRERRLRYRERMEQEKVRFQLDALRSKVDPHFLFNSFTALVELIETDPKVAVDHVDQLSIFFRNILLVRDRERITVQEEVRLLENYFDLEQRRFGAAIALDLQLDEKTMERGIVPLTLQLLVENALKHNVINGGAVFRVTVRGDGSCIIVTNEIRPRLSPPRSTGFGLHSIVARYAALTERPVMVERSEVSFTVRIPLIDVGP